MLVRELKKLKLQSELVSIERDCHDQELTGIISDINDEITSMHLYTDDGDYDGFTVFMTDQVIEVRWGNREHKAISHLVSQADSVTTPKFESKEFQDIIIELGTKSDSICFHIEDSEESYDIGKIVKYDDDWIKMHTYAGTKSLSRMYNIILREPISRIVINSPYQNKIAGLHATGL